MATPRYDFMHSVQQNQLPGPEGWEFEQKLNGFRTMGYVDPERGYARLYSRNHNPITDDFPQVSRELIPAFAGHSAVVDGEMVSLIPADDGSERDSLHALQRRRGTIALFIFDLLQLDEEVLTTRPLAERKSRLHDICNPSKHVRLVDMYLEEDGLVLAQEVRNRGGEGVIAKRLTSRYAVGRRNRNWLKIKNPSYTILP